MGSAKLNLRPMTYFHDIELEQLYDYAHNNDPFYDYWLGITSGLIIEYWIGVTKIVVLVITIIFPFIFCRKDKITLFNKVI